jgi:hypothetical protein
MGFDLDGDFGPDSDFDPDSDFGTDEERSEQEQSSGWRIVPAGFGVGWSADSIELATSSIRISAYLLTRQNLW